jgi:hypothetical protein
MARWIPLMAMITALGSVARADDKADAQKHFNAGTALMTAEDFTGAVAEFEASVKLFPTMSGIFNLANGYKALHRYSDALATVSRLRNDFGNRLDGDMRAAVNELEEGIWDIVAQLTLDVEEPSATVEVDGVEIDARTRAAPMIVGPGDHAIRVTAEGFEPIERKVSLVSGDKRVERFVLERTHGKPVEPPLLQTAAPSPPPAPTEPLSRQPSEPAASSEEDRGLPSLFWVGLGGTIVLSGLTGYFAYEDVASVDSFEKYDQDYVEAASMTEAARYDDKRREAAKDVELYDGLSIGFGVASGVFLAGTVVVLATGMGDDSSKATVSAAPGGVMVRF